MIRLITIATVLAALAGWMAAAQEAGQRSDLPRDVVLIQGAAALNPVNAIEYLRGTEQTKFSLYGGGAVSLYHAIANTSIGTMFGVTYLGPDEAAPHLADLGIGVRVGSLDGFSMIFTGGIFLESPWSSRTGIGPFAAITPLVMVSQNLSVAITVKSTYNYQEHEKQWDALDLHLLAGLGVHF